MNSTKRNFNKGFIVLNKGERVAVISLLVIIVILLAFSIFRPMIHFSEKDHMAMHRLDSLLAAQDAALEKELSEKPKNDMVPQVQEQPVAVTKGRHPETKTTYPHRETLNKEVPSAAPPASASKVPPAASIDLNLADSLELIKLPQIGAVMASRIQRYRNRLGGFVTLEQLYEVKGMDTMRFETIKPYITLNHHELQKLQINQDDFKTLLRHPYLEYEQVKALVNHRERRGLIKNWEQVKKVAGEVNPLLEQYLIY